MLEMDVISFQNYTIYLKYPAFPVLINLNWSQI